MPDNSEDKSGPCEPISETQIDEMLAESFPASDPPSWTLGVDPCPPEKDEDKETATDQADE